MALRAKDLRVPVLPEERKIIEENAARAGLTVAAFLRQVGMGYEIRGIVDVQQVQELVRINADLGRMGGLLKMWLTDDARTARIGADVIHALLARINERQEKMSETMELLVRRRAAS